MQPVQKLGRSFGGHYGRQIGRLVVAIDWQRQPPWRQQRGQIDHRNDRSYGHYLSLLYLSSIGRYLRRRNVLDDSPELTRWTSPQEIVGNFMVCVSHLGQVLLRSQMLLPVLFLNVNNVHTLAKENWKR